MHERPPHGSPQRRSVAMFVQLRARYGEEQHAGESEQQVEVSRGIWRTSGACATAFTKKRPCEPKALLPEDTSSVNTIPGEMLWTLTPVSCAASRRAQREVGARSGN